MAASLFGMSEDYTIFAHAQMYFTSTRKHWGVLARHLGLATIFTKERATHCACATRVHNDLTSKSAGPRKAKEDDHNESSSLPRNRHRLVS